MLRTSGFLLAGLLAAAGYIVLAAPLDATQGVIQKIIYVHGGSGELDQLLVEPVRVFCRIWDDSI